MKLELLTKATVVDDAIRFVSQKSRDNKPPSSSNDEDKNESNGPDCNEYKDQLEAEQEEEAGEIATTYSTTNQIF